MLNLRPRLLLLVLAAVVIASILFLRENRRTLYEERLELEASLGAIPLYVEAPDVVLYDRAEKAVPLKSYRGRVVFVNFWATWCGPCVAEMASLIALEATLDPEDIAFVAIAEDDTWPPVDSYLRRRPLPFEVFRDRPPRVEKLFKTTAYPTSFVIDREGKALYRFNGPRNWNRPEVRRLLALEGVDSVAP